MRNRVIGPALAAALSVTLIASTASADVRTVKDERGESRALDIASAKLNNGTHRLVGTVRLTRKSMRRNGSALVAINYRKPKVMFTLGIKWGKKGLRGRVVYQPSGRRFSNVTKRCDVRVRRHRNRVRIGVDQDSCFRRHAGRLRFGVLTQPEHGEMDYAPRDNKWSEPIRRG